MRFGARFQPWVKLSKYLSQAILATPALIKVDEIGQNQQKKQNYSKLVQLYGKRRNVSIQSQKRPFLWPHLDEAMDHSGTPLGLMLYPPLFMPFEKVNPFNSDQNNCRFPVQKFGFPRLKNFGS